MHCRQEKQVFVYSKQTDVPNRMFGGKISSGRTPCEGESTTLKIATITPILPLLYFFTVRLGEIVGGVSSMQRPGTKLADQHV